jgi:hypothetical protein
MKKRKGFVSNSSSSSFVVAFPFRPKRVAQVQKLLFGKKKVHSQGNYSTKEIAKYVMADIRSQDEISVNFNDTIRACIEVGGDADLIVDKFFKSSKKKWKISTEIENMRKMSETDIPKKHRNKPIYVFHYSDEDGSWWSMMEHSNIFEKLPHEVIDNH